MRFVKISQDEFRKIGKLYESVMSFASYGLFLREGHVFGEDIAERAMKHPESYFKTVAETLKARGWVDDVVFSDTGAIVHGSVEAGTGRSEPGCHRLRGIMEKVYEKHLNRKVAISEVTCEGKGDEQCEFKVND